MPRTVIAVKVHRTEHERCDEWCQYETQSLGVEWDEMVEKGARALAYEAGKDLTDWYKTQDVFLKPWRDKSRIVLIAALGLEET